MFHLQAEAVAPSIPIWWTVAIGVGTLITGGGGIAALMKVRNDRKQGVATQEVAEDDAIVARWKQITQAQVEILLEPMQRKLEELEEKMRILEAERDAARRKYWSAIPYIRALLNLLHRNELAAPAAPANIAEDI